MDTINVTVESLMTRFEISAELAAAILRWIEAERTLAVLRNERTREDRASARSKMNAIFAQECKVRREAVTDAVKAQYLD